MVLAHPTDDELREKIRELVPRIDLNMGMKKFVKLLSKELGDVDLKPRKQFIKDALTEAINDKESESEEEEEEEEEGEESSSDEEEEEAPKKRSSGKKGGGGLAQPKEISDKLAQFLGKGKTMARTDIVKSLWEYIREHNLQNPENKREILLDEDMREVFGCDTFTMFTMNKYISAHVGPDFKPVDLSASPAPSKKRKAKKAASGQKKKRKAGTQPPYRLSPELQDIVGAEILPRPQVVSKIWVYIKANNLQDEDDKRQIVCDAKLLKVLKKPKISMFKMNSCIGEHLIEKLDKSAYQHEGGSGSSDSESE